MRIKILLLLLLSACIQKRHVSQAAATDQRNGYTLHFDNRGMYVRNVNREIPINLTTTGVALTTAQSLLTVSSQANQAFQDPNHLEIVALTFSFVDNNYTYNCDLQDIAPQPEISLAGKCQKELKTFSDICLDQLTPDSMAGGKAIYIFQLCQLCIGSYNADQETKSPKNCNKFANDGAKTLAFLDDKAITCSVVDGIKLQLTFPQPQATTADIYTNVIDLYCDRALPWLHIGLNDQDPSNQHLVITKKTYNASGRSPIILNDNYATDTDGAIKNHTAVDISFERGTQGSIRINNTIPIIVNYQLPPPPRTD